MLKEKEFKQMKLQKIIEKHNIVRGNSTTKMILANKIKEQTKLQNAKTAAQKERMLNIVRKILEEQKRKEQIKADKDKSYAPVPKKKTKDKATEADLLEVIYIE